MGRRRGARASPPEAVGTRGTALATSGLALVLALLTGICTWVALDAARSSDRATGQLRIASAQEAVLEAVLAEHAAQLRYLECPLAIDTGACTTRERRSYEEARRRLGVALQQVDAVAGTSDRSRAAYVKLLESRYDLTVQRQFARIDDGREREARQLERESTGPEIEQVLQLVRQATVTHQAQAAAGISDLGERTHHSANLIPVVFGFAFLLLGGCWAVLVSLQRRLRRQARALSREKALVDGVISAIPHLVYWKDAGGRYQGMNRAFRQQRDADPEAEALPLMLAELEREVTRTGRTVTDHGTKVDGPDGMPRHLILSVIPRSGPDGTIDGVIGVGTDVTLIRELEHQLTQAQRLESIGQLAAGLAHEINTPMQFVTDNTTFVARSVEETLTALHELARLSEQGTPDPADLRHVLDPLDLTFLDQELRDALTESQTGLRHITEIVRAMKDFSRTGEGRSEADLNAAIDATVTVSRAEWKDVAEVDLDLDPDLGRISCHEGEVKQVLLNVVVNAAQAISEGRAGDDTPRGHIRITTRREPDRVRITVSDDGPGMAEDVRRRVFDPFFTTRDVGKGTGQGLSMAHTTIVKGHGGTIDVVSSPGQGTTFVITLPAGPRGEKQAAGGTAGVAGPSSGGR